MEPVHRGTCYETVIDGQTFVIATEAEADDRTGALSGQWRAWSFFAYDHSRNIFPADHVPAGVKARESIVSGYAESEIQARSEVEASLRRVITTKNLDGTGFYSPPAGRIYPQEFPEDE